jgi:hypothetical protein
MAMATLTVKNIPDDVYQELKSQAEKQQRSLNQEIIACLEQAVLLPRPGCVFEGGSRAAKIVQRASGHGQVFEAAASSAT